MARVVLVLVLVLVASTEALAQTSPTSTANVTPTAQPGSRIARIVLDPRDIFEEDVAREHLVYGAANFFHIVTKPHVIRAMLLFDEGDALDPARLEETERNLRDTIFLRAATVTARPLPDGGSEVRVETSDKWTIRLGVGVALAGGVGKGQVDVGDGNLFGLGKDVNVTYIQQTDRQILRTSYEDPILFGTRIELGLAASFSDLGLLYAAQLRRPFFSRETPYAWRISAAREDSDFEYFRDGEEIATAHRDFDVVEVAGGLGFGPTEDVKRLELEVEANRASYEAPEGEGALLVRWPRNRDVVNVRLRPTLDRLARYRELERLDTNRFIEDVPAGYKVSLLLGEQTRIDDVETKIEALLGAGALVFLDPSDDDVIAIEGEVAVRHDGHAPQAHTYSAGLRAYHRFPWQTLALNVDYASVFESEDLDRQLTLGEDNGLRGYEARRFDGTDRILVNLEDRIFTDFNILRFYLGFVVFVDAGLIWYEDQGPSLSDVHASAGFGLRVFSAEFLKRRVLRLDVAFPFDPDGGPGVSVSFSASQVFTLFGTTSELDARF